MTSLADLLAQGTGHAWLFIPSALLLGALHGLEPGHSKTMIAAFIVAVRGTVWQAILLGLSATASHTLIVWVIGLAGLYFGRNLDLGTAEPWFQLASAVIIIGVALWMVWRTWREGRALSNEHDHDHHHDHGHRHEDEIRRIDTGHGVVALAIFEDGAPPRFRITAEQGHPPRASELTVTTTRPDGAVQAFVFVDRAPIWNRSIRSPSRIRSKPACRSPMARTATTSMSSSPNITMGMTMATIMAAWTSRLRAIRTPMSAPMPTTSKSASPAATSPPVRSSSLA